MRPRNSSPCGLDAVDGDHGEEAAAHAHKDVGADAGIMLEEFTLKADQSTKEKSHDQSHDLSGIGHGESLHRITPSERTNDVPDHSSPA